MTYDITTVKGFPILLGVNLRFLAQGWIFVFLLAQKSQNKLNVSQITFWVLVFESILTLTAVINDSHLLRTPASCPFLTCLLPLILPGSHPPVPPPITWFSPGTIQKENVSTDKMVALSMSRTNVYFLLETCFQYLIFNLFNLRLVYNLAFYNNSEIIACSVAKFHCQ